MSNAVFKYYNASNVLTTYTCIRNFSWKGVNEPEPVRVVNTTDTGIIYEKIMYTPRTIDMTFDRMPASQKTAFLAIKVSGLGWLYPDGLTGDGYWGRFSFSKILNFYNKYNTSLSFIESKEEPKDANTFLAKIQNNDDIDYTDIVLQITGVDTATLITAGTLESDLHNLMIYDGDGAGYDYWVQPETTNSANAKFWVKLGNLKANDYKFLSFNIDDDWNYTQNTANVFAYFNDFSGYALASDINGQDGWTTSGGNAHVIGNDSEGNYLLMNAINSKASVYRTLANTGDSFAFYRFRAMPGASTSEFYRLGWGDTINAGTHHIENGYYTRNETTLAAPTVGSIKLCKIVNPTESSLANTATVQNIANYYDTYFSWYGQYKRSGFRTDEVSASDDTFSSQDKLFFGIQDGSGTRNYCRIQYVFTGKTTKSAPTITIIGQ